MSDDILSEGAKYVILFGAFAFNPLAVDEIFILKMEMVQTDSTYCFGESAFGEFR